MNGLVKFIKTDAFCFYLGLVALSFLLSSCCNCPECPHTTVVTPPASTVVTPSE